MTYTINFSSSKQTKYFIIEKKTKQIDTVGCLKYRLDFPQDYSKSQVLSTDKKMHI